MRKPIKTLAALPTLVTLGNAFCGLLAATYVIEAMSAGARTPEFYVNMERAVAAMLVAMVFDFLDGKVARLMGAESAFGVQIDSLSDVLSFGLVPALMFKTLYQFEFGATRKLSLILACFYLFGAVLRLARFNAESEGDAEGGDKRSFKGLPSPSAAAGVGAVVFLYCCRSYPGIDGYIATVFPYVVALLGVLMWTRLPYIHVANVLLTEKRHFSHLLIILVTIGVLYWEPPVALAVLMIAYALSGPILYVWDLATGRATVEGESLL